MTPTKEILKYLKVRALAERGEKGERDVARRKVEKMEQGNASLRQDAEAYQRAQQTGGLPPPRASGRAPGSWEAWVSYAREAFTEASEAFSGFLTGRQVAQEAEIGTHVDAPREAVVISLSLPLDTLEEAANLSPAQLEVFQATLGARVRAEVEALFAVEASED